MSKKEAFLWIEQAKYDSKAARLNLKGSFYATTCFLTQQVAEKTLKAFLLFHEKELIKEHRLLILLRACEKIEPSFLQIREETKILSQYYAPTRYVDLHKGDRPPFESYREEHAKEAIEFAEKILRVVEEKIAK